MDIKIRNKISKTMLIKGTTKGKNNPSYIDNRTNKTYYCKDCGKEISYQSGCYGSGRCRSCATKEQMKNSKNNPNYKNGITLNKNYCIDCGKKITYRAKRCKKCSYIWKKEVGLLKGKNNPMFGKKGKSAGNYIHGNCYEPYPLEFNAKLKLKIRKRDNYTCQNCGIIEEEHIIVLGRVLSVHHIDYNKENCKEDNLITLCNNCNTRVNFKRKHWKNYFKNRILKFNKLYIKAVQD